MTMRPMPSPIFDQVTGHYYGLTHAQRDALASMPVTLTKEGNLPIGSPPGGTLKALARKGIAECRDGAWRRTELGERLWEAR